ncbi:MAG: hypothetical protein V3581_03310 [Candidatus Cardinium sp.]|uniref:hypothetical protein n=1 Tax=Candidatus Cardinium sp. TP TaxID=2961955 RepID=UPI0021AF1943|nr:hypothetical protein [Candidatus Cardinium sp. TP]MCT4697221.1 hypothetical protein [Candidatus Cardinium sp. TP]
MSTISFSTLLTSFSCCLESINSGPLLELFLEPIVPPGFLSLKSAPLAGWEVVDLLEQI